MEASVVTAPETEAEEGAPSENGAEATRTAANLFQYSRYIHVGGGAEECEHREDGKCADSGHFHGWVCLPNKLRHADILDKARAAKARRRRALLDAGDAQRGASDAYVTLEADLDALMRPENRESLVEEIAAREVRKGSLARVTDIREGDDRFENYWQDREEWLRLKEMDEDARPKEEFESLDQEMTAFEEALDQRRECDLATERAKLNGLSEEQMRDVARDVRIDGDTAEAHLQAYYLWMGFACTRVPHTSRRVFETLEEYRNAAPETIEAIDDAIRDLEGRHDRGEAAGNS